MIENLPFTERTNPLSSDLDGGLTPIKFLRTIRSCDSQIYSGFEGQNSSLDAPCVTALTNTVTMFSRALSKDGLLVLSGCGTSGRIAYLLSSRYNALARDASISQNSGVQSVGKHYDYSMAGGDSALLLSDEMPEDDPACGAADLRAAMKRCNAEKNNTVLIAISCGLSAPYAAGQLATTIYDDYGGSALLGFNPSHLAREVALRCMSPLLPSNVDEADACRYELINPILGPEAVTGSSRMKGGSATLALLDTVLLLAAARAQESASRLLLPPQELSYAQGKSVTDILLDYQRVHSSTYTQAVSRYPEIAIPAVMSRASDALAVGGKILYLGCTSAGALGCIDASEMPDTYGSAFDQVRGYVAGGWGSGSAGTIDGDLSDTSFLHRISLEQFVEDTVPRLTNKDCVIILLGGPELDHEIITAVADSGAAGSLSPPRTRRRGPENSASRGSEDGSKIVHVLLPLITEHRGFADYALKIMTNAVTTYAQASGRGAVYKSLMITAGPANDKIFMRCVRLIANNVPECNMDIAERALICSIHGHETWALPEPLAPGNSPRSVHIAASVLPPERRGEVNDCLPVAFLLATNLAGQTREPWTVAAARAAVAAEPRISLLLERHIKGPGDACRNDDRSIPKKVGYALGIDIGGTNVRCIAVGSSSGSKALAIPVVSIALPKHTTPLQLENYVSEVVKEVITSVDTLYRKENNDASRFPVTVGVGQPGAINAEGTCISSLAAFPNWGSQEARIHYAIQSAIEEVRNAIPVCVFDDANSALAAEIRYGAGRLAGTVAMITIGTGFGTSVSIDGHGVHTGARGLVEMGHSIVTSVSKGEVSSDKCSCGQHGCLEVHCSGRTLNSKAVQLGLRGASELFEVASTEKQVDGPNLDSVKNAIESSSMWLAIGILNMIRAYDPHTVIIGGNSSLCQMLLPRAITYVHEKQWELHDDCNDVNITQASCDQPGALGAAALALQLYLRAQTQTFPSIESVSLEVHPGLKQRYFPAVPAVLLRNDGARERTILRVAAEEDRAALYNVCLRTGDSGDDASHLFTDHAMLGAVYVGPYLTFCSSLAFALVTGTNDADIDNCDNTFVPAGTVAGYVLGCLDTLKFNQTCHESWWPVRDPILLSVSESDTTNDSADDETADGGITSTAYMLICGEYPSHLHIDLLPQCQGKGYGAIMINTLLAAMKHQGSKGVHLQMSSHNNRAYGFYLKLGFKRLFCGKEKWILGMKL
eukprot:GSChrysophyteH1.ASY1.ANO1.2657.1 assembled CDS